MGKIKLIGNNEPQEGFGSPDHVDMWYDTHTKTWVIQTKDKYNNQIGESEYISGKQSALKVKKEAEEKLQKELNK
jgi:hypothetical protein